MEKPAFADLKILCGDYSFSVHRCIVVSQCAYFADACRNNAIAIPPTNGSGSEVVKLDMGSEDPVALRSMLRFFYTGVLEVPLDHLMILGGPAAPSIEVLRKVYKLAVK